MINMKPVIHIFVPFSSQFQFECLFSSPHRCPLNGWLWNASTTGSSPIRVTCGVTVGDNGGKVISPKMWKSVRIFAVCVF